MSTTAGVTLLYNVTGERLDQRHCETLEEILRRVQFRTIDLEATHLDVEVSSDSDINYVKDVAMLTVTLMSWCMSMR